MASAQFYRGCAFDGESEKCPSCRTAATAAVVRLNAVFAKYLKPNLTTGDCHVKPIWVSLSKGRRRRPPAVPLAETDRGGRLQGARQTRRVCRAQIRRTKKSYNRKHQVRGHFERSPLNLHQN